MEQRFADREEAGRRLADAVAEHEYADPVVLALPRGGVPVAVPVAERLGAPLDLLMVRKIGTPGNPELASGAVVDGPAHQVVFNREILRHLNLAEADFEDAIAEQLKVIEERRKRYLAGRAPLPVKGRDAVVVDDGIATGATVKAALKGLQAQDPASITLAVPVGPPDTVAELRGMVDRVVCLETPAFFGAVGAFYDRFDQVTDDEVARTMDCMTKGDET